MTTILFFGRIRDAAGFSEMTCDLPRSITTVALLRMWLAENYSMLAHVICAPEIRAAVDQRFCWDEAPIAEASEIAFMSPLSGG